MGTAATLLMGLVIIAGIGGALTQLYPGPILVLIGVGAWGVLTRGPVGWSVAIVAVIAVVVSGIGKYAIAGAHLRDHHVPGRSMLVGGLAGIVGFFVVPVIGLPLGFVLGVYAWEYLRCRDMTRARRAAWAAVQASGLSILIELAGCLVAAAAWCVGLFLV